MNSVPVRVRVRLAAFVAFGLLLSGCAMGRESAPQVPAPVALALEQVATGLSQPAHVWHHPDEPERIFVAEQVGRVVSMGLGGDGQRMVLDIADRVGNGGERGLFAVGFQGARMFVHYTDKEGDSVVSSFAYHEGAADKASEAIVLRLDQPYPNHNGGQIAFHAGSLFIGFGDGGGAGDPQGNGQDLGTWLGKILRINVDDDGGYETPSDNPFVARSGAKPEVWAYGLRNPWRFSFTNEGDLFVGDVGQNTWEEVDFVQADEAAGSNFGWNRYEGRQVFRGGSITDHVPPIHQYRTGPGGTCAVTGGYAYRGEELPALQGVYVFADYCGGTVWGLVPDAGDWKLAELLVTDHMVSSFGEDASGELYLVSHRGSVFRLVAA